MMKFPLVLLLMCLVSSNVYAYELPIEFYLYEMQKVHGIRIQTFPSIDSTFQFHIVFKNRFNLDCLRLTTAFLNQRFNSFQRCFNSSPFVSVTLPLRDFQRLGTVFDTVSAIDTMSEGTLDGVKLMTYRWLRGDY